MTIESPPVEGLASAFEFETATLDVDGVGVDYQVAGRGEPLLAFLPARHAAPSRGLHLLAESARVYVLEAPPSPDEADKILSAAARAWGFEQVDLLGTAEGAVTATRMAAAAPDRVRRLVLESPISADGTLPDILAGTTTPTLVLFGTEDERSAEGSTYKHVVPTCTFALVYASGGDLANDRPEAFAATVGDFLARGAFFVIENRSTLIYP